MRDREQGAVGCGLGGREYSGDGQQLRKIVKRLRNLTSMEDTILKK